MTQQQRAIEVCNATLAIGDLLLICTKEYQHQDCHIDGREVKDNDRIYYVNFQWYERIIVEKK